MPIKSRGFPLEYYPGEILTEREARINRKIFFLSSTNMGGIIAPNVSVILPPPTAINIIEFSLLV